MKTCFRFVPPADVFGTPEENPRNECFCADTGQCAPSGLFNISKCQVQDLRFRGVKPGFESYCKIMYCIIFKNIFPIKYKLKQILFKIINAFNFLLLFAKN